MALAAVVGAALLVGCGESRHANEQRPQVSTRVSVVVNQNEILVQPGEVGFGAEPHQEIEQNEGHPAPPLKTKAPLNVIFVIANQTNDATTVQILDQSREVKGVKVQAHSPQTVQASLKPGTYTVASGGSSQSGQLRVGSYRESSQNDVLLP